MINHLEDEVSVLHGRIDRLSSKFWQMHLFPYDVTELAKLNDEIIKNLSDLDRYVLALQKRKRPFPIQPKVVLIRDAFEDLDDKLKNYLSQRGHLILKSFQEISDFFMGRATAMPEDIHKQLIEVGDSLIHIFSTTRLNPSLTPSLQKLSNATGLLNKRIQLLRGQPSAQALQVSCHKPLRLSNIGNSCYMDSALQALCCFDQVRERMDRPLLFDPNHPQEYQKKLRIQREVQEFTHFQEQSSAQGGGAMTQMEYILSLWHGPSLPSLREAIFESGLHPDLTTKFLTAQHDAACIVELFMNHFLEDCKFKWRGHTTTPVFDGLEFLQGTEELVTMLGVHLNSAASEEQTLSDLITRALDKQTMVEKDPKSQRLFDPHEGIILPGKEENANLVKDAAPAKVEEYTEWYRLTELPPVFVIQIKRFTTGRKKLETPVILPKNGILDLSHFYDPPEGSSKQALYKIKSMVTHQGKSLHSGHYVADVEINGRYFHCNDLRHDCYELSSRTKFFANKQPYLLFLERLPDQEHSVMNP